MSMRQPARVEALRIIVMSSSRPNVREAAGPQRHAASPCAADALLPAHPIHGAIGDAEGKSIAKPLTDNVRIADSNHRGAAYLSCCPSASLGCALHDGKNWDRPG